MRKPEERGPRQHCPGVTSSAAEFDTVHSRGDIVKGISGMVHLNFQRINKIVKPSPADF